LFIIYIIPHFPISIVAVREDANSGAGDVSLLLMRLKDAGSMCVTLLLSSPVSDADLLKSAWLGAVPRGCALRTVTTMQLKEHLLRRQKAWLANLEVVVQWRLTNELA
jgi:hypothetical protein